LIETSGGRAAFCRTDIREHVEARELVAFAERTFGGISVLVNNASAPHEAGGNLDAWMDCLRTDLLGPIAATQAAIEAMRRGGAGGAIVNIASISALRGDGTVAYSAAKGGLIAMTVDMAYSHGRQGIRVNAVAPGHITTPMVLSVSAPGARAEFMNTMRAQAGLLGTAGTGWDVGWAAAFLASDEARWITGVTLPVESGLLSVTPLMMAPHLRAVPDPGCAPVSDPGSVPHPGPRE
jgi:NAD(P)-dependent dehydrogenase (short-subunit alcohol dehydrogenase family)